ncbi:diaminopimelate decarboxylase [Nitrospirillum iridis]|uniref:Diaminopimelate decarboxylase n=1 Tax=Nitrospirillum iridis TaxID=765888 RepID=A0A7X0B5F8_9PROT|nr:diaminopimelate decarboxylase [Nitrospirillum iridis]MBB6254544.1 diaminopimelate decarboxylase [Nitrospirillum iridis]
MTEALSILRIKQTICSGTRVEAPLLVVLGADCGSERVSNALGNLADRVQYVISDAAPTGEDLAAVPSTWWQRHDLRYRDGRLHLGGVDLAELATQIGTPSYVYRAARVRENIERLDEAMSSAGIDHRLYYAMKANRSPALLSYLRTLNLCGVDVCSAGELLHAVSCGFPADAISFTGTSLTRHDIQALSAFKQVRVNLDSLASLNSLGRACPGRAVGLRVNPGRGLGYHGDSRLNYSGAATTKFGIYPDHVEEAKAIAATWDLRIVRLHVHAGCGYLDNELGQLADIFEIVGELAAQFADLEEINIGGGLGVPHVAGDKALDLRSWAAVIARHFAGSGLRVAVEPGDYLVKDAGLLLTTVTYVERRRDVLFAGLDAGFNLAMEPAFYGLPCEPVAVAPRSDEETEIYTIVGNINEALDRWATGHRMPRLQEGDYVALLNCGGYAASMRSDHCLRGQAREVFLID